MPNWCNNYIIIQGDESYLNEFYSQATDNGFIVFSKLFPVPNGVDEDKWKKKNWTARTDPSYRDDMMGLEYERDENSKSYSLVGYFRTKNVPPYQWLCNVQQKFPTLNLYLSFCEPLSCDMVGELFTQYDENSEPYLDVKFKEFLRE